MPLSRLSTRSRRTTAVRSKQPKRQRSASSRHLRLWDAIRTTRKELDHWQSLVEQVDRLFQQYILPREHRMIDAFYRVTDTLMDQFINPNLNSAERSLLGLWVTENLQSLSTHPFASKPRRGALNDRWRDLISKDGNIENQLARLAIQRSFMTENTPCSSSIESTNTGAGECNSTDELDESDIVFDFGWHSNEPSEDAHAQTHNDKGESLHKYKNADSNSDNEPEQFTHESLDDRIDVLEKRLSVDRLFRQLARVLHPDREQDVMLKAEKHILMSQCLQARQDKDINTLLTLYCEHVGDLPDDLSDTDHDELIAALHAQLKQLQSELQQIRTGNPLQTQIVERYQATNETKCEQHIQQHAKALDQEIRQLQSLEPALETRPGLLAALEERRTIEWDRMAIDEMTGLT